MQRCYTDDLSASKSDPIIEVTMFFFRRLAVFIACSFGLLSSQMAMAAVGAPTMSIVSGDGQAVASNSGAPLALTVMVRDSAGNPVAGVKPTWTVLSGPG